MKEMICPLCPDIALAPDTVEASLVMQMCPQCHGRFLTSNAYFDWLDEHGKNLPELPPETVTLVQSSEPNQAKRCPECGGILVPYKVGRETHFSLDRCFHCGGIWFDANEWETLRARNLHDDIHLVFTKPWQEDIRQEELARQREARLRQTFGSDDYEELVRIKRWLDSREKSREMYSFLLYEARILHTL